MAESLRALPQLVDALREISSGQNAPSITEEERGMLLVLRLKNPTQRNVAKAMGLSDHTSLRKYPVVIEAIRRFKIMKTVTVGNGRSITDHTLSDEPEY
ncbi:hypothetical protein SH661x_002288 [Planctomicrobium sp. SH661]|uniref:hypothetical protein n=1 Tax=Planctomicrobium sp. SH661 TaxID=3448124 RepID=UPI003F5B3535